MRREKSIGKFGRIVAVSCAVLLVLVCSLSFAAATAVSIQSAEVLVGESVTLPIVIADAAEEISCATISVSYEPTIIKVTSAKDSGFDALLYNPDTAQGKTTIVVYQTGAQGLSGTLTVAELTFEAVKVGSSSVQLQLETLKNNAGLPVAATVQGGSVTVKADGGSDGTPTPSPSPTLTPSPSPSPAGGGGGGGGGSGGIVSPLPSPSPSLSPAPSPSASVTPEPSPLPSPAQGIISVRIDDLTVASSDAITATIRIEGIDAVGLSSARITLTYNPKIVKVLSANAETSDFDEFVANIESGTVRMIGYQTGAEGLTGDATFAQLQLKAAGKPGEQTTLGLEVTELIDNEGQVLVEHGDFEVVAGSLTITDEGGRKLIPTFGLAGTVAMVIGAYLLVRKRRDR